MERTHFRNIMNKMRSQNFMGNLEKLFESTFKQKSLKGLMRCLKGFCPNTFGFDQIMLMFYDQEKDQLYTFTFRDEDENKNKQEIDKF